MEQIQNFAPVIIPTLNRYEHFKRCIESLSRCTWAEKTEVYVGLDYPPSEKYREGYEKINNYLENCGSLGFKQLHIIKRERNYGASENWKDLKQLAYLKSDTYIGSEDDNEFSPCFLDYINKGLNLYKDDSRIYAICGYNYPIDMTSYSHTIYFSHEMPAWGLGTWKSKEQLVDKIVRSPTYLKNLFQTAPLSFFFKDKMRHMGIAACFGREYLGDTYITKYLHLNDVFTILPKISLVRNWGHDGTGVNCGKINCAGGDRYICQEIDLHKSFYFEEIEVSIDEHIYDKLVKFKEVSLKEKVKNFFLFILVRVFVKVV